MNEHLLSQLLDQADYHVAHQRWLHASQGLVRILQEHPDRVDISLRLADVYARMGSPDAAERTMLSALARDPGNVDVLFALGRMFYASERYDEALRYLEQLLPYHVPHAQFTCGLIHFKREQYPAAERHFRRTLELDPEYLRCREMLGKTLLAVQRYEDARTVLIDAAAEAGDDGTSATLLGSVCALLGLWDEAVPAFRDAVHKKPADAGLAGDIAMALARGGRTADAEEFLRIGAAVDADAPALLLASGVLAMERADRERARECFRRVLDRDPGNDAALQYLNLLSPSARSPV